MIRSWSQADTFLGKKDDRPTGERGTRIQRRPGNAIACRYHTTDVVTWYPNGYVQLNSGNWHTMTTKARMVAYAGVPIWSEKCVWYLGTPEGRIPFWDHMVLAPDADGLLVPQGTPPTSATRIRLAESRLSAKIHKYIAGYGRQVEMDGALRVPDMGDCWGCMMEQADGQGKLPHGKSEPIGLDHYLAHFDDQYYVPSLYANALSARYANPGLVWHMRTIDIQRDPARGAAEVRRDLIGFFKKLKPQLLHLILQREGLAHGEEPVRENAAHQ